jgi:hypothetical protein
MKRTARIILGTVLSAAIPMASVCMSAGQASAAVCSGYTCHGLDSWQRCTETKDAEQTVGLVYGLDPQGLAILHNAYSRGCNSNWAWVSLTSAGYGEGDSVVVVITTLDSRGHLESMCYPGPNSTGALNEYCYESTYRGTAAAYTDMVDGTHVTQAYAYVYGYDGTLIASAEQDQ